MRSFASPGANAFKVTCLFYPLLYRRLLAAGIAVLPVSQAAGTHPASGSCPSGTFICPLRTDRFALCGPDTVMAFYDPTLPHSNRPGSEAKIHVQARQIKSTRPNIYHLTGQAKLTRADQQIQAEHIQYNNKTTAYKAIGNVRYQQAGQLLQADQLQGDTGTHRLMAKGHIRFQLLQSHANGSATRARMLDARHSIYNQVRYSTCHINHHLWELRARQITIDKARGRGIARDATLHLAKLPFLYLPYLNFPLDNRRTSGFLYPNLGHTSSAGFIVGMPYYFNLAPNNDATLEPRVYSRRGLMLSGQTRYLLPTSKGQLDFEYLDHDRFDDTTLSPTAPATRGRKRWLLKYTQSHTLWPGWSVKSSIQRASDRSYLRDFGNNLYTMATGTLTSRIDLYASGKGWNASFGADSHQNVDPSLPDSVVPYKHWPRATFNLFIPLNRWLEAGVRSEAAAFRKPHVVQGNRLDVYPYIDTYFRGNAWFIHPRLAWRYTAYRLNPGYSNYGQDGPLDHGQSSPFTQRSPHRSLPVASIDSGMIFERDIPVLGHHHDTQTLEPRLYYLYVPYRRQSQLPLFDTTLMSFNDWQLFSSNAYSGADRQMNANNLTAAVTTRLLDSSGVTYFSLSLGQIRYFTPQRIPLTGHTVTHFSGSNYVTQMLSRLGSRWYLKSAYQWNPNTRQTGLGVMELQHRIGLDGVFHFSYRFRRGVLEQYATSTVYPISTHWRALGHWIYSVRDKRTVGAMAGIQYEGCCMKLSVLGRHYATGLNGLITHPGTRPRTDNAFMFELELKGLGTINSQAENYLRHDIPGYR